MDSKFYAFSLLLLVLLMGSCRTAKKMYEKGNYDEAVELAARKLQKDPDDPQLLEILRNAYRFAVQDHEGRIRNYASGSQELKWEWMYHEYADLQKMYTAIYKVPAVFDLLRPADYSSYLVTYAEKAGQARYQRGNLLMQQPGKPSFKNAYREFQAALRFLPGDRDVQMRLEEAYSNAVTNVVILPGQETGGYRYSSFSSGARQWQEELLLSLQRQPGNEFVQFYSPWEARNRQVRVDLELDMQLVYIHIGRYEEARTSQKLSREVVIRERVIRPDSVVKEYGKVVATLHHTRRSQFSEAVMQIRVRDGDGRRIWNDENRATHTWSTEFHEYTGDARALSDADRQLVERRKEFAPTEEVIADYLAEEISRQAQWRIKNYFSRF